MSDGESDDGRRAVKKRKASRACDRCNSQHQPCDNATPKCSVCVRAGTDCTYNRPVRKRGPRSGYTGQNGERLWAVVLQARPDIEDIVLQVLRGGTYGDTGVSTLEYYRNNDNQAELVSRFNESRIAQFLQNGESADLSLPPIDEILPLMRNMGHPHSNVDDGQASHALRQSPAVSTISNPQDQRMTASPGSQSAPVNPHGAPQNPSDIYLRGEDVRRRTFDSPQDQRRSQSGHSHQGSPALQHAGFASADATSDRRDFKAHIPDTGSAENSNNRVPLPSVSRTSSQSGGANGPRKEYPDLEAAYQTRWSGSVPKDTLLNLGFAPGDDMEEDFIKLCANPDPIDSTPTNSTTDQEEDEEAIWRRLVMRGRFV